MDCAEVQWSKNKEKVGVGLTRFAQPADNHNSWTIPPCFLRLFRCVYLGQYLLETTVNRISYFYSAACIWNSMYYK